MPTTIFPAARPGTPIPSSKGEMLRLINGFDWASTPLGPMQDWPAGLTVTVRVMLASPLPMVMLMGREGVLVYNDGYAEFAGKRHPDILGMKVAEAWPEIADFNIAMLKRVLGGEAVSLVDQHMSLNRQGSFEDAFIDLDYSPVLGEDGVPIAELVIVRETTARVLAERALERSEESLSFALAASGMVGIWDWDVTRDIVTSDEHFATMYGVDPARAAAGAPIGEFVATVHVDDRGPLTALIDSALRQKSEFRAEYRLMQKDGSVRWVLALGRAIVGASGKAERLPGVVVDITDRKAAEAALILSEAKFRAIADSMPQMVWSTLPDGFHDYYNARWYEFTGVPEGSTDGEGWNDMFHPEDRERAWSAWRRSLETGAPYEIEYRLRHRSGQYRWTLGRALPIRDEAGGIVRWMGTCTDIHATKLAAEERSVIAQELSHRIKNIFSVLNAMIGLSAKGRPELRDYVDELKARIQSLGIAHDMIRPPASGESRAAIRTTLHTLVGKLLSVYGGGSAERIVFTGDDPEIDEAAATPFALLFHELGTNAAKYGALQREGGRIEIISRLDGDRLKLVWREAGGPAIQPPANEGFGTRLVTLSVRGQLGGTLERHWNADGLVIEVEIPASSLSKPT